MQLEILTTNTDPFMAAVELADKVPLEMPNTSPDNPHGPRYQRWLRLCYWLSVNSKDGVFTLPAEQLSCVFRQEKFYVYLFRRQLVAEGVIEIVQPHIKGRRQATFRLTDRYAAELKRMMRETSN